MTHKLDADDFFIHRIQEHCAAARLNFFLIEPVWVDGFFQAYSQGKVWARVLLNMHSEHHRPDDIYHQLIWLAHQKQTRVIDPPETAIAAFDKARLHPRLIEAGIKVPPTLIVPREKIPGFVLSPTELELLGSPFVIKPCMGYGRNGVQLNATEGRDLLRSLESWPNPHYLVQRKITPGLLNDAPAYFRVYYVFGTIWCAWWNCFTDRYRPVSALEKEQLLLSPLEDMARRIAQLTGMKFFSTEIALTEANEFVVIDYVNDQCHLLTQTSNPSMGVPDEMVAGIAKRLVEAVVEMIRK